MNSEIKKLLNDRPMPRKLADPLLTAKPYYFFLNFSIDIFLIMFVVLGFYFGNGRMGVSTAGFIIVSMAMYIALYIVAFPKIPTNALYLRNFSKDKSSEDVREHIEVMLGKDFRLSGIRDPRKRINLVFRPLIISYMALQYAGARFLNLEAGNDWKARIWSNFRDIKIAFIDLRELTDFVKEEIELSIESLGLERLVFIIDNKDGVEAWKARLIKEYSIPVERHGKIHIVIWTENKDDRKDFMSGIEAVLEQMPQESVSLSAASFSMIDSYVLSRNSLMKERLSRSIQTMAGMSLLVALIVMRLITGLLSSFIAVMVVNSGQFNLSNDINFIDMAALLTKYGAIVSVIYLLIVIYFLFRAIRGKLKLSRLAGNYKQGNRNYFIKQFMVASVLVGFIISGFSVTGYGIMGEYNKNLNLLKSNFETTKMDSIHFLVRQYSEAHGQCPDEKKGLSALLERKKDGTVWIDELNGYTDWEWEKFHKAENPLVDVWGNPYQYKTYYQPYGNKQILHFIVYSLGPDGIARTNDDRPKWWDGEGSADDSQSYLNDGDFCKPF